MQKKPALIAILSVALLSFALLISYFALLKLGPVPTANYAVDLWAISAGSVLTAIGVWRVRPWGFFLFLLLVAVVVWRDVQHNLEMPHALNLQDVVDLCFVGFGLIFIMQKHARAPYFDPRIRWWERPPRHKVEFSANLTIAGDKTEPCQILDVSHSGCYVETKAPLSNGQIIGLNLVSNKVEFHSPAKVVRIGLHPPGVGMMFIDTTPQNKKAIKEILSNLKK